MNKLKCLILLCCALGASSSFAVGLSAEDLIGDYSGKRGCILEVRDYPGNMLEITLIKKGRVEAVEFLAKYRVESIAEDGKFKIEQEYYGFTGRETKEINGKISNFRLVDIELSRSQGNSSINKSECKDLVRLGFLP